MEGDEETRKKFNLSMRMNGFSSDLLHNYMKRHRNQNGQEEEEDEVNEEIELDLGLSMNGRFGVDPMRKKLKRSSSISNLVFTVGAADNGGNHHARGVEFDSYAPLARTRSLPTEAEEEWRRRKEFQSMKRMEARRKRMEKLKNVRVMRDKDNCCEDVKSGNGLHEAINGSCKGQRLDNGILIINSENGNEISSPQGSIGSQRSGSSGISDVEFHPKDGAKRDTEAPPSSHHCSQDHGEQEPATGDPKLANQLLKNAMLDMPYVSTKGDGPNGHRIEGFLYRYKKGEEVRIVCVCHGFFLTPAEFVKHGGGDDVEHPLKHIVVNPFPLL